MASRRRTLLKVIILGDSGCVGISPACLIRLIPQDWPVSMTRIL